MTPQKGVTGGSQNLDVYSQVDVVDPNKHVMMVSDDIWMKIFSFTLETTKDYYALCLVNKKFFQYTNKLFPRVYPPSVVEMKKIRLTIKCTNHLYLIPPQESLAIMDQVFVELEDHQSPLYRRKDRRIAAETAASATSLVGRNHENTFQILSDSTTITKSTMQWPRLDPTFFEQIYRFVQQTRFAARSFSSPLRDRHDANQWRPLYDRFTARFQVLAGVLVQQWQADLQECFAHLINRKSIENNVALAIKNKVSILHNLLMHFINHWNIWQGQVVAMAKTGCLLSARLNGDIFLSLKDNSYQCLGYLLFCSVSKNDDDGDDETDDSRLPTRKRQKTSVGVVSLLTVLLDHIAFLLPHLARDSNHHNADGKEKETTTKSMQMVNGNGNSLFEVVSASFRILDNLLCANHVPDQRLFPLLVMDQHIQTPSTHNPHYHIDVQAFRVKVNETKALLAENGFRFEK